MDDGKLLRPPRNIKFAPWRFHLWWLSGLLSFTSLASTRVDSPLRYCSTVDFAAHGPYHAIVDLPPVYHLHDFSKDKDPKPDGTWSVGKFDEIRPTMYDTDMFQDTNYAVDGYSGVRDVHVGLDIGGPVGTPVRAWHDGTVLHAGYNADAGDYGNVIVTEHRVGGVLVYALYGHLTTDTLRASPVGRAFRRGEVLGGIGDRHENGGWPPHVHFQLSLKRPETHDLPGVVSRADREEALETYPDPRLVLGMLYT